MKRSPFLWLTLLCALLMMFWTGKSVLERYYRWIELNSHSSKYHPFLRRIVPLIIISHPRIRVNQSASKEDMSIWCTLDTPNEKPRTSSTTTLILTGNMEDTHQANCIYVPPWSYRMAYLSNWSIPHLLRRENTKKTRFCALMKTSINEKQERFFTLLQRHKRVHRLTMTAPLGDKAVKRLESYKFAIAFEDDFNTPGYVTEKLVFPLLTGCIPIYLGHVSTVDEQFNPNCLIQVAKFPSYEACIDYVLRVDREPALYQTYLEAPIIEKEKLVQYASWYFGSQTFFAPFFKAFPRLFRYAYIPLQTDYRSDPTKPIKIINLNRSTSRWTAMQKQLDAYPFLKYERFPAVEGKLYYAQFMPHMRTEHMSSMLNAGELGIYLSTMEVLYALTQDDRNDYYVILEDDVQVDPKMEAIETYVRNAPASWDVLYLGVNKDGCADINSDTTMLALDQSCMPGNFAVIFRKRAAQYYLNFALPIVCPVDFLPQLCHTRLNYFMLHPKKSPIQAQYDMVDSTIGQQTNRAVLDIDKLRRLSNEIM